jgi:serine/threonine protein kinase
MAPEQFTDASSVDHRADIYALGMTLYHMLAGRLPWETEGREVGEFTIMTMKAKGELRTVTDHYPDVPAYIVSALQRALDPAPDARPQSVAEFLAILKPGKSDAPATTVKAPSPPPPVAPVKPQVDPGHSPGIAASQVPTPTPAVVIRPTVPQTNKAPRGRLLPALVLLGLLIVAGGAVLLWTRGDDQASSSTAPRSASRSSGSNQSVGMNPTAGLRAYYAALDRRDQQMAYRFFRMSGWDNDRWKRKLELRLWKLRVFSFAAFHSENVVASLGNGISHDSMTLGSVRAACWTAMRT